MGRRTQKIADFGGTASEPALELLLGNSQLANCVVDAIKSSQFQQFAGIISPFSSPTGGNDTEIRTANAGSHLKFPNIDLPKGDQPP